MTKTLESFEHLAQCLVADKLRALVAIEHAMGKAVAIIQKDANGRIGEYQQAVGPFPQWEPLADSTEFDKARGGYPVDAPLLREGDLRDSIEAEHHGMEGIVGSKDPIAGYQEFGTASIPPRPFIGPAGFSNHKQVKELLGRAGAAALGHASGIEADYASPSITFTKT